MVVHKVLSITYAKKVALVVQRILVSRYVIIYVVCLSLNYLMGVPSIPGVYCMGPMSLLAIRRGEVHLPYDGRFVFAEVNADKVYWVIGEDRAMEKKRIVKNR